VTRFATVVTSSSEWKLFKGKQQQLPIHQQNRNKSCNLMNLHSLLMLYSIKQPSVHCQSNQNGLEVGHVLQFPNIWTDLPIT